MYYVVFGILYAISLLPLAVLYLLSDLLYFITWYIVGYRKKVVNRNLLIAFPEKSAEERRAIAKKFYRCFWDNWIESIKMMSISRKGLLKRMDGNLDVLAKLAQENKACYIMMGHQFNWEWGNSYVMLTGVTTLLAAYSPLSSTIFDRLFLYLRTRFGAALLPFNHMSRAMLPFRNRVYALALMADQSPPGPEKSYWPDFFSRPTAFLKGPEKGARRAGLPVVFLAINRKKRGHYFLDFYLLHPNAGQLSEGELTRLYVEALEKTIRENPASYLWSHKRWKHEFKDGYDRI